MGEIVMKIYNDNGRQKVMVFACVRGKAGFCKWLVINESNFEKIFRILELARRRGGGDRRWLSSRGFGGGLRR